MGTAQAEKPDSVNLDILQLSLSVWVTSLHYLPGEFHSTASILIPETFLSAVKIVPWEGRAPSQAAGWPQEAVEWQLAEGTTSPCLIRTLSF